MKQRIKRSMLPFRPAIFLIFQVLMAIVANRVAFALRFDSGAPVWAMHAFWQMLPWLVAIRALTFIPFKLYEGLWRYTSIYDLRAIITAVISSTAVFFVLTSSPLGPPVYPR